MRGPALLLLISLSSPAGAVWKKDARRNSNAQRSDIASKHKYFTPLQLKEGVIETRKRRYKSLSDKHDELLTDSPALLSVKTTKKSHRKDYKKIILTDHVSEFTGPIKVGTPGQDAQCIFDTGSSLAWIMSDQCNTTTCNMHNQFSGALSKTFVDTDIKLNVQFGTGSLRGRLAHENIHLGGIVLENQSFGQIQDTTGEVFTLPFDGICGLSFQMSDRGSCLLEGIKHNNELKEKSFTFYFGHDESALIFGEPDKSIRGENVEWYPVSREYYWETPLKDIKVGGESVVDHVKKGKLTAVFDTGTSVLTMPTSAVSRSLRILHAAGLSCEQIERGEAPEICYSFENRKDICIKNWYERDGGSCTAALMTLDLEDENIFILGEPHFYEYVTTFDAGNSRIGVAPM